MIATDSYSQYIIAGHHNADNYFHDVIPDTTMVGPYNHQPPFYPAAEFHIDINGDGINEFFLHAYGVWALGFGQKETSLHMHNYNCQIAYGYSDTCWAPDTTLQYFTTRIAKSFQLGDTINDHFFWSDTIRLNLAGIRWWAIGPYECEYNGFINYPLGNYIGVRIINSIDTLYGWIKVTDIGLLQFTIQEFACSEKYVSIDEKVDIPRIYPNPTLNFLTIETKLPNYDLVVYNQYGQERIKQIHLSQRSQIDFSELTHGVYILKITNGNTVIVKKIIKE
ncbi:MAG: T9SS type A sorting domain-containing protein [Bacteroidales bacterium]|jgi:hypothetical protein|nr:T9SS type A sorting domain-containing protein [Bacteroidales bacterium]